MATIWSRWKNKRHYSGEGIKIAGNVELGNNVQLDPWVNVAHHAQISNAKIGARTSVGRYSKIQFAEIGKYCSISWDVTIGALEHPLHAISTHAFSYRKQFGLCDQDKSIPHREVIIENDVWIGCGVIIMPGVHIGSGAVIGAGALVTHDVAPYEIVGGVPASHLEWRFEENVRNELLSIQWWNFSDQQIKENMDIFDFEMKANEDKDLLERLRQLSDGVGGGELICKYLCFPVLIRMQGIF